jgi:hypothetical protein
MSSRTSKIFCAQKIFICGHKTKLEVWGNAYRPIDDALGTEQYCERCNDAIKVKGLLFIDPDFL